MIAATDVGSVRPLNEDCVRIVPEMNISLVADGMGGHKAGEVASRMAVNAFCRSFEEQLLIGEDQDSADIGEVLAEAISTANNEVYTAGRKLAHMEGMGTTLVATCFDDSLMYIGHVGDSRCYRFSNGELVQLTEDHTLATDLMQDSPGGHIPAYSHHVLKKALGIEAHCEPDLFSVETRSKDIFLLCSDGLSGAVDDNDISTIMTLRAHEPELCIDTLIRACVANGAPDNISIVLVFAQ
jgi:serine/threonine protein phosphatase PrpC